MSHDCNIDYPFGVVTTARRQMLRLAQSAGLEPQLRMVQRAIGPRETRRTMRDDEALRLLLALTLPADANCVDVGANAGISCGTWFGMPQMGTTSPSSRFPIAPLSSARRSRKLTYDRPRWRVRAVLRRFTRVLAADTRSGFDVNGYDVEQVEQFEVEVGALDEALPAHDVPSLIKLDVEGAELEVLRGGLRVLTEHKPIVVFEHDARGRHRGVVELLADTVGLRIFDMDGDGPLSESALRTKVTRNTHWNFIAHR